MGRARVRRKGGLALTARDVAKALLVEDFVTPGTAELLLTMPVHIAYELVEQRNLRAELLRRSGWQETPQSERAGRMVRALLAL